MTSGMNRVNSRNCLRWCHWR